MHAVATAERAGRWAGGCGWVAQAHARNAARNERLLLGMIEPLGGGLRRARASRLTEDRIVTLPASHDMSDKVKLIFGGIVAVLFGLRALSRRFPQVGWLQHFYFEFPQLTEQQKARMRRLAALRAGLQLILLGIVLPIGYVALT